MASQIGIFCFTIEENVQHYTDAVVEWKVKTLFSSLFENDFTLNYMFENVLLK